MTNYRPPYPAWAEPRLVAQLAEPAWGANGLGSPMGGGYSPQIDLLMVTMSKWMRAGRRGVDAGAVLRFFVSLLVALQIVYTPIHLAAEPHSDEADLHLAAPVASYPVVAGPDDHGGDGHHERHSAAPHKLKVVRSPRAPAPGIILASVATAKVVVWERAPRPVFVFSGLSPPELPRSWQFLSRTALPVRAPSHLS